MTRIEVDGEVEQQLHALAASKHSSAEDLAVEILTKALKPKVKKQAAPTETVPPTDETEEGEGTDGDDPEGEPK